MQERKNPHGVVLNAEEKSTRERVLEQVWISYVEDDFDLANLIQTKTEFSYAMAVMDRVGGWMEGGINEDGSQICRKAGGTYVDLH